MTNLNWYRLDEEVEGSTENMFWLSNDLKERALFKPDTTGNDFLIEEDFYKVACFFDISCSYIEPFVFDSIKGFLSHMKINKRFYRVNGYDIHRNKEKFSNCFKSNGGTIYSDNIDYSISGFNSIVMQGCFEDLCNMAFIDAICRNMDRHQGNLDFLVNYQKQIISLAPLYDNVLSIVNSSTENTLFGIDSNRVYTHKSVFQCLRNYNFMEIKFKKFESKDFIEFVKKLNFYDFFINRINYLLDNNNVKKLDLF